MATGSNLFTSHEAKKLVNTYGSGTQPVYINSGVPTATSYYLQANIKSYTGSLASGGWAALNGKGYSPSIAIAYNNSPATWNSATYSASLVWGCNDTRGLLDCCHSQPIVTFGGTSYSGATDDNPKWYMKISGTSGATYTLPSASKTLAATDGSNASGTWGISISGNAATATKLATARSLWGNSFDGTAAISGTIRITPTLGSWQEGIRIKPYGSWSTIVLGGNDLTADTGTSANSWSIHNNNGNFYITRNGSTSGTAQLSCKNNVWSWNGTATGSISGNAATATAAGVSTIWMYPERSNEINFGGTNATTTLFFGYRARDSRPIPTNFVFGSSTGTATVTAGKFIGKSTSSSWIDGQRYTNGALNIADATNTGAYWPWIRQTNTSSGRWFSFGILGSSFYWIGSATSTTDNKYDYGMSFNISNGYLQGCSRVYAAVWNDYAEYRQSDTGIVPGHIVQDNDNGTMTLADARLIPGAQVVSDTFGFAIGETDESKTPIAVSGRALVYTYQDRYNYHAGMAVCSAPGGTVDIMTREEIKEYPDCIIGIVSEIPEYETWGSGNVAVDGRIWIKVR